MFLCSDTRLPIRYLLSASWDQGAWQSGRRSAVSRSSVCPQLSLLLKCDMDKWLLAAGLWPCTCLSCAAGVRMS